MRYTFEAEPVGDQNAEATSRSSQRARVSYMTDAERFLKEHQDVIRAALDHYALTCTKALTERGASGEPEVVVRVREQLADAQRARNELPGALGAN